MQPTAEVLLAVLALPFLGAAAVPVVYPLLRDRTAYLAAVVAAVCFGLIASQYGREGTVAFEWMMGELEDPYDERPADAQVRPEG